MSTTTPTDYTKREARLPRDLIRDLQEAYESALGDSDKAGEVEAVCYYDGLVDAFVYVLECLTVAPDEDVDE